MNDTHPCTAPPALSLEGIHLSLGAHAVLHAIDLHVAEGERLAIVGPNGAGKSSLLHVLAGRLAPDAGCVRLFGRELRHLPPWQRAQQMAVLHQAEDQTPPLALRDYVALGRIPHGGGAGDAPVEAALHRFGLHALADRRMDQLSGGQRRLAALARAVAQTPRVLLLDEPTNHLDLRTRIDALDAVATLGITVVAVLHELSLAPRFAQRVLVMQQGRAVACGAPATTLAPPLVHAVFRMDVRTLPPLPGQAHPALLFDAPPGAHPFDAIAPAFAARP